MIEERALVIETIEGEQRLARVRTQRLSACDSCQLKSGCGTHSLAKLSGNQSVELELPNQLDARVGDVVMVAIPERGLLSASVLMYMLPLITMMLAVLMHQSLGNPGEPALILSALAGLVGGFLLVRRIAGRPRKDDRYEPRMVRVALSNARGGACETS